MLDNCFQAKFAAYLLSQAEVIIDAIWTVRCSITACNTHVIASPKHLPPVNKLLENDVVQGMWE